MRLKQRGEIQDLSKRFFELGFRRTNRRIKGKKDIPGVRDSLSEGRAQCSSLFLIPFQFRDWDVTAGVLTNV